MAVKSSLDTDVAVKDKIKLSVPKMWNVILHNDQISTMEFVILVLMQIFHKNFDDATEIMLNIHESGRGVAGTYSHEVAEQKMEETLSAARTNSFPLQVTIEPID